MFFVLWLKFSNISYFGNWHCVVAFFEDFFLLMKWWEDVAKLGGISGAVRHLYSKSYILFKCIHKAISY